MKHIKKILCLVVLGALAAGCQPQSNTDSSSTNSVPVTNMNVNTNAMNNTGMTNGTN